MKLSSKEKDNLDKLARMLRERFKAKKIVLYGSAARDKLDKDSDIDLLVVLPEVNWQIEKDIIQHCFDAELECGRVFSAVCFSIDEIENSPLCFSPFVLNIHKDGRSL